MSPSTRAIAVAIIFGLLSASVVAEPQKHALYDLSNPLEAYRSFARAVLDCDADAAISCLHLERELDQPWIDALAEYLRATRELREATRSKFGDEAASEIMTKIRTSGRFGIIERAREFSQRADQHNVVTLECTDNWALVDSSPFGNGVVRLCGNNWLVATTPSFPNSGAGKELNRLWQDMLSVETEMLGVEVRWISRIVKMLDQGQINDLNELSRRLSPIFRETQSPTTQKN